MAAGVDQVLSLVARHPLLTRGSSHPGRYYATRMSTCRRSSVSELIRPILHAQLSHADSRRTLTRSSASASSSSLRPGDGSSAAGCCCLDQCA